MKLFFTVILLFIYNIVFSQEGKIIGKIVDAKTNKPVKEAHVVVYPTSRGTASNALGYFELSEKMPAKIVISHVGYQISSVDLSADKPTIKIVIEPISYTLDKLVLKDQVYFDGFTYNQEAYELGIKRMNPANDKGVFTIVEAHCAFPGGIEAFHKYLIGQLSKKSDSLTDAFSSTIDFTITPEGILRVDSIRGVGGKQAGLLKKVFSSSPKWIPAIQGANTVAIHLTQVIEYSPTVEIFKKVDQQVEFTGGMPAFYKLIAKNLQCPPQALKACVKGTVFVSFVINQYGEVEDIDILKGLGYGCDEEVIRVIRLSSGKWIAAKQEGKPVKVRMSVPVKFGYASR